MSLTAQLIMYTLVLNMDGLAQCTIEFYEGRGRERKVKRDSLHVYPESCPRSHGKQEDLGLIPAHTKCFYSLLGYKVVGIKWIQTIPIA